MTETNTGWLTTADHKRVGLLYLFFSLLFLLVGGAAGAILKTELTGEGVQIVGDNFSRLFNEHATVSTFLFLAPAWVGLAAYLVPLQIGASRVAFPRALAFSLWTFVCGGALVIVSYMVGPPGGGRFGSLGLSNSLPMAARRGGGGAATDLWVMGLLVLSLSALVAATTLAVTILKLRVPGLTLRRTPMFSTATLVTSIGIIMATPVFVAGLVLLYIDQHYGGRLFLPSTEGYQVVWQHTLWLFGRPEVFLLSLPALGAACDIVATHARRGFLDDRPLRAAIGLFGLLSFGAWWLPDNAGRALVLPNPPVLNAVLGVPVGIIVLVLLGTLVKGRLKAHVSLLFVAGYVLLLGFGAINGIIAGLAGVDGKAWTEGHLHVVIFGGPTLLVAGAVYHWAPKLFGRQLSAATGGAVFLLLFGGFLLMGLGDYLLGYNGAPAHVNDFPPGEDWGTYATLGTVGGYLLTAGALLFTLDVMRAAGSKTKDASADPYEGLTLEWAAASPPPPHNFDAVPEVRSPYPVLDLREGASR
jgi:heme/copper-type cytochrome/quinol oxidase subunit 1